MRIIKYLFLLLLLAIIALTVFVATQKGDFDITQSTVIPVPKPVVFNYVNDYKNWEDWSSWKEEDPGMTFIYPDNTVGNGASYSWSGSSGKGKMTTIFIKENDSIAQKVSYGNNESTAYITFKDTLGKTKVTWHTKGSVSFMDKVYATFTGGVNQMAKEMFQRSLNNLNKLITKEINTFDIKVNGIVTRPATFYIKQSATCSSADVQSRLLSMLPKVILFFKKNNIRMNGSPFVIYDNIDNSNNTITFSVCGPLREEIFLSPESDISVGKLEPFSALKTTLTGDYSHRSAARKKAADYLKAHTIEANTAVPKMDVYVKSASDIKSPSKWITEILIPVRTSEPRPIVPVTNAPAPVKPVVSE